MAKVAMDLNPGVQKVSCDLSVLTQILSFPVSLSSVFEAAYLEVRRRKFIKFRDLTENRKAGNTCLS